MALIKTQLMLVDRMTAPMKSITRALNTALSTMESVVTASGKMIDTRAIEEARRELGKATKALDELDEKANQTTGGFSRLLKAIGGVAVAREGLDLIKQGVDYASDLAEVQNVVDVTFGNSAAEINAWSKAALEAYGMNEVSAKKYTGTMGAMLKSSGLAGDSIVDMSKDLVGLAGDMASFYNLDIEEAFTKIRSGISGETEPLKQLGINMSVANLEAFALSQGITKSYNSMSQAEQVLLRYNYLLSVSSDAQGDFVRTGDSFANQTKKLTENWRGFLGVIASGLLPALTKVVAALNAVVLFLSQNWDIIAPLVYSAAAAFGVWGLSLINWSGIVTAATGVWARFTAILAANPLVAIILGLGIVIALFNGIINGINKTEGKSISAAGVIGGAIFWVGALLKNLGLVAAGIALGILSVFVALGVNIKRIFQNSISEVQKTFWRLAATATAVVAAIAKSLNKLPFVNIDVEGLTSTANSFAAKAKAAGDSKSEYLSITEAFTNGFNSVGAFKEGWSQNAYDKGYSWASNLAGSIGGGGGYAEEIAGNTAAAADSAGSAASSQKETTEDLKYLRDIAEQEAINRFTTAEVKIDMTGMTNRIDSSMDIDGIISALSDGFVEAIQVAAEGAH